MEYCKKNIVAKFRELFSAQMPLGSLKVIESMFISIRILKRNKNIWQVFYLVFSLEQNQLLSLCTEAYMKKYLKSVLLGGGREQRLTGGVKNVN